jgi:hypothetical protein
MFFCARLQGTTKEVFVANAIRFLLEHYLLFTHHHVAKVTIATTNYRTNMGIAFSTSLNE